MSRVRSLLLLVAVVAVGSGLMSAVYGRDQGVWTAIFLAILGGPALALTHLVVAHRARLGSVSRQLLLGVGLTVGVVLLGATIIGGLLVHSFHDAYTMAVLLSAAVALGAYAAWLLSTRVAGDIGQVRDAVQAVQYGDRSRRIDLEAGDEVAELGELVNRLTEQLTDSEAERAEMERVRRDLLAAVSHDLRSPLSSVRILIEGMQAGFVDQASQRRALDQLAFHVQSLDTLIDDLFELSRIEAGDVNWSVEPVLIGELLAETIEGMGAQADAAGVVLRVEAAGAGGPVLANPEKIQRVLYNLLENAIAHSPAGAAVTVELHERADTVEIDVVDRGTGVASSDQQRIFEPFFRGGPETSRPRDGAGLGLPICRAIVEAHHGRILLVDAPRGTRVRFTLPRERPANGSQVADRTEQRAVHSGS